MDFWFWFQVVANLMLVAVAVRFGWLARGVWEDRPRFWERSILDYFWQEAIDTWHWWKWQRKRRGGK